jgi:hypothetical protein
MTTKLSLWPYGVALSSLAGFISILIATVQGIGVSPDSVAYLGAARNLLDGRGLSLPYGQIPDTPLTHFPPLYALLLSASGLFRVDPVQGARWTQAFLFALLIALVGYALYAYSRRAAGLALLGSLFIVTSPTLLGLSMVAWTEALFLVVSLLALLSLARFLEQLNRPLLIICALLVAAATLTRYAGVALGLTAIMGILLLQRGARAQKLYNLALFSLLSGLPLALWLLRNASLAGSTTNREFSFHPIARNHMTQALGTVSEWLMIPASTPSILKLCGVLAPLLLVTAAFVLSSVQRDRWIQEELTGGSEGRYFQQLLVLFVLIYGAFLALSISFVDANTPLDSRILSPVYMAGLLLIFLSVHQLLSQFKHGSLLRMAVAALAIPMLAIYALQGALLVTIRHQNGNGFSAEQWRQSQIIPLVISLPAETPIYSNTPEGIYFLTERPALGIPKKMKATTQEVNDNYTNELEVMKERLKTEQGVMVYFTNLGRSSTTEAVELQMQLDLSLLFQTDNGSIFQAVSAKELAAQ